MGRFRSAQSTATIAGRKQIITSRSAAASVSPRRLGSSRERAAAAATAEKKRTYGQRGSSIITGSAITFAPSAQAADQVVVVAVVRLELLQGLRDRPCPGGVAVAQVKD